MRGLTAYCLLLTWLDSLSTWFLITHRGTIEANPIVDALIQRVGLVDAMLIRGIFGSVLVIALAIIIEYNSHLSWGMKAVAVILSLLIGWHTGLIIYTW